MPMIKLPEPFEYGVLVKRYKRFLVDVELKSGIITAYCPNPGRMLTCSKPGSRVRLSYFKNTKRKYAYQLDLVHNGYCWVGVNPSFANQCVRAAILDGVIFSDYSVGCWESEVRYDESRRIDFLYTGLDQLVYVEVKGVSMALDGVGMFPDAVSKRAVGQLDALVRQVKMGHRAIVLYCILRSDVTDVVSAEHIDKQYATKLEWAKKQGVEVMTLPMRFDDDGHGAHWHIQ